MKYLVKQSSNVVQSLCFCFMQSLYIYVVYVAYYLFFLVKINAIKVLTCITLLLHATAPGVLISIWLWHFILHQQ